MQNCVFLYLVLVLLHRIGFFLADVAEFLMASYWDFMHPWLSDLCARLNFARSQIRIRHLAEFMLIPALFLLLVISLDRTAFWSL